MRKLLFIFFFLLVFSATSQIAHWNKFPSLRPSCYKGAADKALGEDLSFAFALRKLYTDYKGPLIQLRRASDNAVRDFFSGSDDAIDLSAIDAWRAGSNVFVVIWYDQSCQKRNAEQVIINQQPRFFTDTNLPYFQGNGNRQYLTVDTPNGIQDVTANGVQGTVISILRATRRNQHTFGVLTGGNRWSAHGTWGDRRFYFDPGICCNSQRQFFNADGINVWAQYSFVRTATNVIMRKDGIQRVNGLFTNGDCTRTEDFAIGWATGNQPNSASTTAFNEFIMYATDINQTRITALEQNQINFWNL